MKKARFSCFLAIILTACHQGGFSAKACIKKEETNNGIIDLRLSSIQEFRSPLAKSIQIYSGNKGCVLKDVGIGGYVDVRALTIKYEYLGMSNILYIFPDGSSCYKDSLSDLALGLYPKDSRLLSSNEMSHYVVLQSCSKKN